MARNSRSQAPTGKSNGQKNTKAKVIKLSMKKDDVCI